MAGLTVLLIGLCAEHAGPARPRPDIFELENRDLVHVDHEHQALFRIGCRGAPIRAALVARHRNRVDERGRREDAFVARLRHTVAHFFQLLGLQQPWVDIVDGKRLPRERRRPAREGLRRPGLFAGHVTLRHRPFFDRPQRLTRHTVEDVQKAGLAGVCHGIDAPAVVLHGHELGG